MYTDFAAVRKEIEDETDRAVGGESSKNVSKVPINLRVYSPHGMNCNITNLIQVCSNTNFQVIFPSECNGP